MEWGRKQRSGDLKRENGVTEEIDQKIRGMPLTCTSVGNLHKGLLLWGEWIRPKVQM